MQKSLFTPTSTNLTKSMYYEEMNLSIVTIFTPKL